ncbi:MAG: DNA polymerase III subunit delta' [Clostridia bacterium]|nr:DNA polymerase III subunit delta' [Clostridia bacterium]
MQELTLRPFLKSQLMRPVTTGRIVHAQIFAGPEGTGKHEAALFQAKALNCTGSGKKPCGVCPSCLRFSDSNAPELIEIRPEKNVIKVDVIRDLIKEVSLRTEGRIKCVVFYEADRMNEAAQNALLKTLEEPPAYVVFYLLTQRVESLLPTIRSRCTLLRFSPSSESEVASMLVSRGVDGEKAARIARLSFASPGKAVKLAADEEYQGVLEELTDIFGKLKTEKDIPYQAQRMGRFKDKPRRMLEILETCAGELMRGDCVTPLARALKSNGCDGVKLMKAVITCSKRLNSYVSYQYAAEMLLYDLFTFSNV